MGRTDVSFVSAGIRCAAWLYLPPNSDSDVACVVMTHGFGLTRVDGLARYAEALTQAGAAVLVYDSRYLGDSEGEPRQRIRVAEQRADRFAAIAFARTLDGIDPNKIFVWGYSLSGGTAIEAAAADQRVAGAILLCPFADGRWRSNRSMRTQPRNTLWALSRAINDARIPASAEPGHRGALTFPGEFDGFRSVVAPGWRNEVHAAIALPLPFWRPVALARKLHCPMLIQAGLRDISVSARAIDQLAHRAPRVVLKRYDTDHFQPFHQDHQTQVIADQMDWLRATIDPLASPTSVPDSEPVRDV